MIKLFASDMDGTLLNPRHTISTFTAQAIRTLQQSGVEFLIATGRDYQSAKALLKPHQIDCHFINLNGALICRSDGTIVKTHAIPQETYEKIINFLEKQRIVYSMSTASDFYLSNKELYIQRSLYFRSQEGMDDQHTRAQIEAHLSHAKTINRYRYHKEDPALKMMIISQDQTILDLCRNFLETLDVIDITSSGEDNLELTHKNAQKGIALLEYCQENHYKMEEVITIGDSLNDRSMLKLFDHSYAMANASPTVKKIAKYEAPSHAEDGVAQIIYQVLKNNQV